MKIMRKLVYSTLVLTSFMLASCSGDDGGSPSQGSEVVRFTVNVSNTYNTEEHHMVLVGFGGADASGKTVDLKVNGELKTNQLVITAGPEAFNTTRTHIFETVGNYQLISVSVSGSNLSDDVPFTISYKIEKGSKIITDKTQEITKNNGVLDEDYQVSFNK